MQNPFSRLRRVKGTYLIVSILSLLLGLALLLFPGISSRVLC